MNDFDDFDQAPNLFADDDDAAPGQQTAAFTQPKNSRSPLKDVKYTGKFEQDGLAEVNAIKAAMRAKDKEAKARYDQIVDSRFYTVVVFQNYEQRAEFMKKAGVPDGAYCDGLALAEKLGIKIESPTLPYPKSRISPTWRRLSE
jgi:hypothetical protein